MKRAIRNHAKDFAAIIALTSLALFVAGYILQNQRLRFPFLEPKPFELKAEFSTAQAITPGQGQTIRVAGVRIGDIAKAELEERPRDRDDATSTRSSTTSSARTRPRCCARRPA